LSFEDSTAALNDLLDVLDRAMHELSASREEPLMQIIQVHDWI
jgi:hypothetical protein